MEPSSDDQQLSFLDLGSCSLEDKNFLFSILKLEVTGRVDAAPAKLAPANAAPVPISEFDPSFVTQQQQQQPPPQQQQQQQPPFHPGYENPPIVSEYPSTLPPNSNHSFTSYNSSAPPCVFIHNVTANVNVHHGPASHHLHDEHQHHPPTHPAQPQLMSQRFPAQPPPQAMPPHGYPVAPQPSMLPTPQFGGQMPPHSTGFVHPPFVPNPALMTKPAMSNHPMYMHPSVMGGYYMAPFPYGYPMVNPGGLAQVCAPIV